MRHVPPDGALIGGSQVPAVLRPGGPDEAGELGRGDDGHIVRLIPAAVPFTAKGDHVDVTA